VNPIDELIVYSFSFLETFLSFSTSTYGILILVSLVFGIYQYRKGKKEMKEKEVELRKWAKNLKRTSKAKR